MDWKPFVTQELRSRVVEIPGDATGGLPRDAAIEACEGFVDRDVGVLGGDVWAWDGTRFRILGTAGWYADRAPDEPWPRFRKRSIETCKAALGREIRLEPGEQPVYVLVCTTDLRSRELSKGGGGLKLGGGDHESDRG
jgi:hypothetical protein